MNLFDPSGAALIVAAAIAASRPVPARVDAAAHNEHDLAFAEAMIAHHVMSSAIARLAPTRASSSQLVHVAASALAAHGPELHDLRVWLGAWHDEDGTRPSIRSVLAGDEDLAAQDVEELAELSGVEFDAEFARLMTPLAERAVALSTHELLFGVSPLARALAADIAESRARHLSSMRELLG